MSVVLQQMNKYLRNSHCVSTGSLVIGRSISVFSGNICPRVDRVNFSAGVNGPYLRGDISCNAHPELPTL